MRLACKTYMGIREFDAGRSGLSHGTRTSSEPGLEEDAHRRARAPEKDRVFGGCRDSPNPAPGVVREFAGVRVGDMVKASTLVMTS